ASWASGSPTIRSLSRPSITSSFALSMADEFRYAMNCHCSNCRRTTGSAFKPFAGSGSVHNYLGQPGVAAYAATEGGLLSMARSIAADLAPRKIRVNVVAPGATKTPIWTRGVRANATAEESAKVSDFFSSTVPLARWGEPDDVAKAVLFLAS